MGDDLSGQRLQRVFAFQLAPRSLPRLIRLPDELGSRHFVFLGTIVEAYVSRIDPELSFTPENTYFRDDRIKQVVGIKLELKAAFGLAKPGMPADGEVLVQGDTWPKVKHK